jgi:hypothetical protein
MVNLVPIDISNNESALNVLETFMIRLSDWESQQSMLCRYLSLLKIC